AVLNSKGLVGLGMIGVRKKGEKVKVTTQDKFHLGSDTKQLTAVLIAELIQKGKLRLDQTLEKSFPEMASTMHPDLKKVTLLQVLTHRAGLHSYIPDGWFKKHPPGTLRQQRAAIVKVLMTKKPLLEPGTKWVYSNLGYVLIGVMAERATKA